MQGTNRTRRGAPAAAARTAAAAPTEGPAAAHLFSGRIVALDGSRAQVILGDGTIIHCRCAQGIDLQWLRPALAVAPVEAEGSWTGGDHGSVWAIFAGPEHVDVLADELQLTARNTVRISCGTASVKLSEDGRAQLRGREVVSRGLRVNRIEGAVVKINS